MKNKQPQSGKEHEKRKMKEVVLELKRCWVLGRMKNKKYKSCTTKIGEYCSKHGVVHKEKTDDKYPITSCEEATRIREQNMLTNCVRILGDYNIITVSEHVDMKRRIREMPR